ncbi:Triacylglycerol lipase [Mycena kentingensis (nom. inval.)]|nr:Triacylglycerol lipase [Mycena kentingensis (nom. inval.)]
MSSFSRKSRPPKPVLTEEQRLMYAQEKVINFRLVSRLVATHAPSTLGAKNLVSTELQDYLAEIGQFTELSYNLIPIETVFKHLPLLLEPGFPLEGFDALPHARVLRSFVGRTAHLPGFVAYRSNTRQIVVAISGTNVDSRQQALHDVWTLHHRHPSKRGKVHVGFWKLYKGIRELTVDALRDALQEYGGEVAEVVVAGHSMGAAMAQLLLLDLLRDETLAPIGATPLRFVGFGGPRVGSKGLVRFWRELVEERRARYGDDAFVEYAVKMHNDGVPALPPLAFGYRHFVESPYYAEHGKLYRVPPELGEYSLFHIEGPPSQLSSTSSLLASSDSSSSSSQDPPLHPRGGHNYYNGRDMEKVARHIRCEIYCSMAKTEGVQRASMECPSCQLKQRQFYCTNCVRTHTRDYRLKTNLVTTERDEQVARGTRALEGVKGARERRAGVAQIQLRVDELLGALARLRKDNDKKRDRLRSLRESLAERRRTLAAANALVVAPVSNASTINIHPSLGVPLNALNTLAAFISRARSGLVQELVEVFNIVEVGGRPPLGGKAGSAGEWTIGDLILPVPGDVRRYPPQHINAVLGHTIHFIGLLSFYLGIKLPFNVQWEGGKLGVGVPWIGPGVGGWGRWTASHPLHLSLTPAPTPAAPTHIRAAQPTDLSLSQSISQSISESLISARDTLVARTPSFPLTAAAAAAASTKPATSSPLAPSSAPSNPVPVPPSTLSTGDSPSFTTGLAMLLFNVLYLAHTQGVSIPLAQAGDVLSNLWAICCAAELGKRAHATVNVAVGSNNLNAGGPPSPMQPQLTANGLLQRLPAPTPSTTPVDFAHVVQAVVGGGGRRAAVGRAGSFSSVPSTKGVGSGSEEKKEGRRRDRRGREERETEEGWDLVSEDGY